MSDAAHLSVRHATLRSFLAAFTIMLLPVLAALVLAVILIRGDAERIAIIEKKAVIAEVANAASDIVAELQRERGRSSGFLGSAGREFGPDLAAQRAQTDTVFLAVRDSFRALDKAVFADAQQTGGDVRVADLRKAIAGAVDQTGNLQDIRNRVDAQAIARDDMMPVYTEIIATYLKIYDLATVAELGTLGDRLMAANALLQAAQEYAGQERALGALGFGSGSFDLTRRRELTRLAAAQETLEQRFLWIAPDRYSIEFEQIKAGDAAIGRDNLRQILWSGELDSTITGSEWFAITTAYIDQIKALSTSIQQEQSLEIARLHADVMQSSRFTTVALLAACLVCALGSLWQLRSFLRPLAGLASNLNRLAEGQSHISIAGKNRRDLVGFLARAVDAMDSRNSRQFSATLFQAPVPTSVMSLDGRVLQQNPAMAQFLGLPTWEGVSRSLRSFVEPEDRDLEASGVAQATANPGDVIEQEIRFRRVDGHIVTGLLSRSCVHLGGRNGRAIITLVRDITESKNLETLRANFVSTVSHELRTPLTSIRGAIGMLQAKISPTATASDKRLMDIAMSNIVRLTSLINDLLDVDRLEQDGVRLEMSRHEIRSTVETALDTLGPYATEHKTTITLEKAYWTIFCYTDAGRVSQILTNLVSNAIKFSPSGGIVAVTLDVTPDQKMVKVSVRDNGPGISESFQTQIFERFKQAEDTSSRSHGGSGLGLYLSRGLVRQLGGEIGFFNNTDGGATFWFTLPIMGHASADSAVVDAATTDISQAGLPMILHVEDDASLTALLSESLEGRAIVKAARSLYSARRLLDQASFDLILLDWDLPDGSATQLLEHPKLADGNVLVASLSADDTHTSNPRIAIDFIKSDVEIDDVARALLEMIRSRRGKAVEARPRTDRKSPVVIDELLSPPL